MPDDVQQERQARASGCVTGGLPVLLAAKWLAGCGAFLAAAGCEVAGGMRRIPGCWSERLPVNRQRQTLFSLWSEQGFLMDATAAGFMTWLDGLMLDL